MFHVQSLWWPSLSYRLLPCLLLLFHPAAGILSTSDEISSLFTLNAISADFFSHCLIASSSAAEATELVDMNICQKKVFSSMSTHYLCMDLSFISFSVFPFMDSVATSTPCWSYHSCCRYVVDVFIATQTYVHSSTHTHT